MASKKALTPIANEALNKYANKQYVTGGPHLWIATLLHEKGTMSSNRIWDEYQRDNTVPDGMIPSKTFLKNKILYQMAKQKKIKKGRAKDMPQFKRAGWEVNPSRAFKNTEPSIVMKLDPIPQLDREDVRDYIESQFKLFEEVMEKEDVSVADAIKEAEGKHN